LRRQVAEVQKARDALGHELEAARATQTGLVHQLEEKTTGYSAAERMLQESTTTQLQLRRDLRAITQGREQLELQNLELKRILEQLGQSAIASLRAPADGDTEALVEAHLNAAAAWEAVTESDISRAIVGVEEAPTPKPRANTGAKAVVVRREVPEPSVIDRELREARHRIELLEANMGDLEYLREQNAKLSDEWSQDRGAARELTALQMEHKRLRLDLQVATEKLATQSRALERVAQLEGELQEHRVEQELVTNLRRQLRELDAENFALRNAYSGTYKAVDAVHGCESESRELAVAPLEAAVLSDKLGLPIAATGHLPSESLAAVSGLALSNAERVRELLPVGRISTVQWVDQYGMTVTCKLLTMAGDEMAMTTLGAGTPTEESLQQTLKAVLSSIGWTEKGPVDDDESSSATG
jgi:predicted regulator of Ras-like GTPase activity (Roadblock/LC7/MglB family)